MIRLAPVTPENWRCDLRVRADQRTFVADRAGILARAYAYRDQGSRAFLVYSGGTPVGMALYYGLPEEQAYCFSQFFIDRRYQGKGFGLEDAKLILQHMRAEGKYGKAVLCYVAGDDAARRLYEKLGFHHTGDAEDNEILMEKEL